MSQYSITPSHSPAPLAGARHAQLVWLVLHALAATVIEHGAGAGACDQRLDAREVRQQADAGISLLGREPETALALPVQAPVEFGHLAIARARIFSAIGQFQAPCCCSIRFRPAGCRAAQRRSGTAAPAAPRCPNAPARSAGTGVRK